jgi:hypothetical protein
VHSNCCQSNLIVSPEAFPKVVGAHAYVTADVFSICDTSNPRGLQENSIQNATMRLLRSLIPSLLLVGVQVAQAASSWSFNEGTISVSGKGAGAQFKDKYVKLQWDLILI